MSKCNLRWFKPSTCVAQALWITSAPKPQNPRLFLYLMLLLWNPLDIFTLTNWLFRTHLLSKENPQLRSLAVEISQDPRFSLQKWEKIEDSGIWLESLNWPPKKIKKTCNKSQSQNRTSQGNIFWASRVGRGSASRCHLEHEVRKFSGRRFSCVLILDVHFSNKNMEKWIHFPKLPDICFMLQNRRAIAKAPKPQKLK